jgi:hypothetical protein
MVVVKLTTFLWEVYLDYITYYPGFGFYLHFKAMEVSSKQFTYFCYYLTWTVVTLHEHVSRHHLHFY